MSAPPQLPTSDEDALRKLARLVSQSVDNVIAEYAIAARHMPHIDCTDDPQTLSNPVMRDAAPFPLLGNYGVGAQRKYNQDINMLAAFNGRERTRIEFIEIGAAEGLQFVKLWEAGDTAIVELEAA